MKTLKKDDSGVSPIIGVILMIGLTVILSGSVYVMSTAYINQAGDEPEIVNVVVDIDVDGVTEYSGEDRTTAHTYSGVSIEIISGTFDWSNYKVLVNSKRVFTIPSSSVPLGSIPDASSDPPPQNSGTSRAGQYQWFTEYGYREDLLPMKVATEYTIKIVNIQTNQLVWENDIMSHR